MKTMVAILIQLALATLSAAPLSAQDSAQSLFSIKTVVVQ